MNEILTQIDPLLEDKLRETCSNLLYGHVIKPSGEVDVQHTCTLFHYRYKESSTLKSEVKRIENGVQKYMDFLRKMMKLEFEVYGLLKQSNVRPPSIDPTDPKVPFKLHCDLLEQ